ncbi:MAG: polysaccharide lyase 6 family protein [Litorimonas sp.]
MSVLLLSTAIYGCSPAATEVGSDKAAQTAAAEEGQTLVSTQEEYAEAVESLQPGDSIVLANGRWENFEMLFSGKGTEDAPIRLSAETPGKVLITGQSNLRLSGEWLDVSGLVFTDGFTPTREVISFRRTKGDLANNSRVHNVVIDDYNPTERTSADFWVMIYGKNNRFDHNTLVNKRNRGVTMAVRMDTEESRENNHRIDHNYFGPRPILGSNGGETLRIGTSHYSRSDSLTLVENNYFDRCDGEVEIISSKSGGNVIRNNTFYKSRGTLTLRHGNGSLVERNVFLGEGEDHTGGFRVINARQTVRDNYMEGVTGSRFGGALVVMNGVPNGPINRYDPVISSVITNNSLINSDNIQLGAGSDAERSAPPTDTRMENNLVVHDQGRNSMTVYDDMSGIAFKGNVSNVALEPLADKFAIQDVKLKRAENGLLYPTDDVQAGAPRDIEVTKLSDTGASYYPKAGGATAFGSGKTHNIKPGDGNLAKLVAEAKDGDTIRLLAGTHTADRVITVTNALKFEGVGDAKVLYERDALFEIQDGGSLRVEGLTISGADTPDSAGNVVIRTSPYSMLKNYRLEIADTVFEDLDVNHSFDVISAAKGTFANHITLERVKVSDATGHVLRLDRELDDNGIYASEYLTISDSSFSNIGGTIANVYRGGTDESTFGPHVTVTNSSFSKVGSNKRNKTGGSFLLHGAQVTLLEGNTFTDARPIVIDHTVGEPKTRLLNNNFGSSATPRIRELNSDEENTAILSGNTGMSK